MHALYLDRRHTALLDRFYTAPASSSAWIQRTLRLQLRRAAEAEILKTGSYLSGAAAGTALVDPDRVWAEVGDAAGALAGLLAESPTGWFFGAEGPTVFDCAVFAYTHLMVEYMGDTTDGVGGEKKDKHGEGEGGRLGELVRKAGRGELDEHRVRMLRLAWGNNI